MKKLPYILLLSFFGCAVFRPEPPLRLTVTHVEDLGRFTAVYANRGYMVYKAEFLKGGAADSLRRGNTITVNPMGGKDTCPWVFRRIR